jgi:hypothetical protein
LSQGLAAEQAARAGRSAIRHLHACHDGLRSRVLNLPPRTRIPSRNPRIAGQPKLPKPERDMHSEWPIQSLRSAARAFSVPVAGASHPVWQSFEKSH